MLEILRLSKKSDKYLMFHPDRKAVKREPEATYSNHEGRIVGYHWTVTTDYLNKNVDRWQEYERRDRS